MYSSVFLCVLCGESLLSIHSSENYLQLREKRKERLARIDDSIIGRAEVDHVGRTVARPVRIDVLKATACLEHRSPEGESDVVDEKRAVSHADTVIVTDVFANI